MFSLDVKRERERLISLVNNSSILGQEHSSCKTIQDLHDGRNSIAGKIVTIAIRKQWTHPVTTAGPKARAGLIHIDEIGPKSHMRRHTTIGIANGFSLPHCDLQHSQSSSCFLSLRVFIHKAQSFLLRFLPKSIERRTCLMLRFHPRL